MRRIPPMFPHVVVAGDGGCCGGACGGGGDGDSAVGEEEPGQSVCGAEEKERRRGPRTEARAGHAATPARKAFVLSGESVWKEWADQKAGPVAGASKRECVGY